MKLASQKLGAEGQIDLDLTAGNLVLVATENTSGLILKVEGTLPLTYFIDAGADKLNSPLAKSIAALIDGVVKSL